jgi:hypothetical protein
VRKAAAWVDDHYYLFGWRETNELGGPPDLNTTNRANVRGGIPLQGTNTLRPSTFNRQTQERIKEVKVPGGERALALSTRMEETFGKGGGGGRGGEWKKREREKSEPMHARALAFFQKEFVRTTTTGEARMTCNEEGTPRILRRGKIRSTKSRQSWRGNFGNLKKKTATNFD